MLIMLGKLHTVPCKKRDNLQFAEGEVNFEATFVENYTRTGHGHTCTQRCDRMEKDRVRRHSQLNVKSCVLFLLPLCLIYAG